MCSQKQKPNRGVGTCAILLIANHDATCYSPVIQLVYVHIDLYEQCVRCFQHN